VVFHLPVLLEQPEVERFFVFDPEPGHAADLVAASNGRAVAVTGAEEAIEAADAVSICSPNSAHAPAIRHCLQAGKPVICEKPVAVSAEEGRLLAPLVQLLSGHRAAVNLPYRFQPIFRGFKSALSGRPVERITLQLQTLGLRTWRPKSLWYQEPAKAGGGALIDLGVHAIDLLMRLLSADLLLKKCSVDRQPIEERAELELEHRCATTWVPVQILLERSNRRANMMLTATMRDGTEWSANFRSGELRHSGALVERTPPVDAYEGVRQFVKSCTNHDQATPAPMVDALMAEELIWSAYDSVR